LKIPKLAGPYDPPQKIKWTKEGGLRRNRRLQGPAGEGRVKKSPNPRTIMAIMLGLGKRLFQAASRKHSGAQMKQSYSKKCRIGKGTQGWKEGAGKKKKG